MTVRGGVGVDHHVEPQPSLPEGATAAVTEEATAASGQAEADADAASEQVSLNGTHNDSEQQLVHDPAPLPSDVGALNGSQEAPAADPDTDAGPDAQAGAEAEAEPGAEAGAEAEAEPGAEAGAEAEAEPGAEAGADP